MARFHQAAAPLERETPGQEIPTGRSFILTSIVDVIRLNQADAGGATDTA